MGGNGVEGGGAPSIAFFDRGAEEPAADAHSRGLQPHALIRGSLQDLGETVGILWLDARKGRGGPYCFWQKFCWIAAAADDARALTSAHQPDDSSMRERWRASSTGRSSTTIQVGVSGVEQVRLTSQDWTLEPSGFDIRHRRPCEL